MFPGKRHISGARGLHLQMEAHPRQSQAGRHGRWPEVHIFRVAGGQVTEHWDVIDQLSMRTQPGLLLSSSL